ncbi:MAG: MarR family transcriptional regulator [Proteobacteria bacterium]|jgi:DNA-binding MarR family transcriptional regulator|nr:MarR family transcriptional regulator [Pseudomonadota bacterium]
MAVHLTNPQALNFWRSANEALVRGENPDLTSRQMAILLTVYLTPQPHTVRGLAARLDVTKPVVTRALDTLGREGLIRRRRDEADKRSVLVERTTKGAAFLAELSNTLVTAGAQS